MTKIRLKTQKDLERLRKTQKDLERLRKTQKDLERLRKTQKDLERLRKTQKDLDKNINLNLSIQKLLPKKGAQSQSLVHRIIKNKKRQRPHLE